MQKKPIVYSMEPVLGSRPQVLILGSMPGKQSLAKQQYYGNPRNHFWPIISAVLMKELPNDYAERILLLKEHHIALWDVIRECEREGSLDSSIKEEEPNPLRELLHSRPSIRLVAFNGGKAYEVFKKHIGFEKFVGIEFVRLPSTSPVPGRNVKSYEEKLKEWSVLKRVICAQE